MIIMAARIPTPARTSNATPNVTPKPRGRKPGQAPKVYNFNGLSADFLGRPMAVTAEIASKTAPMRVRDERQVAMDRIVKAMHTDWQNGTVRNADGSTTQSEPRTNKWSKMPKASYHVDPQVSETVKMLVRRAADFHGVAPKFGNSVRDGQGREIIVFAIRDRKIREAKPEIPEEIEPDVEDDEDDVEEDDDSE